MAGPAWAGFGYPWHWGNTCIGWQSCPSFSWGCQIPSWHYNLATKRMGKLGLLFPSLISGLDLLFRITKKC